ncbi:hypothetical protein [Bacillus mycoides]|nr:hypothetical protein [Bacillus mycoides]
MTRFVILLGFSTSVLYRYQSNNSWANCGQIKTTEAMKNEQLSSSL